MQIEYVFISPMFNAGQAQTSQTAHVFVSFQVKLVEKILTGN